MDTGVYWCENADGQTSDTVHITVTENPHILSAPGRAENKTTQQTSPPDTQTTASTPPSPESTSSAVPTRSLEVALVCHLLVLCPYIISTVLLVSLCCHSQNMKTPPLSLTLTSLLLMLLVLRTHID
ncbi:hypothetical protein WMY93_007309 [Mugilogobius chulae]|uniref:Ig-like domain-containing protein n=1 Tax=Mugilogobius chulae TaxID=88201 RepID=A0AAW0PJ57_9GOBI